MRAANWMVLTLAVLVPAPSAAQSVGILGNSIIGNFPHYMEQFSHGALQTEFVWIDGAALIQHTGSEGSLALVDQGRDFLILVEGTVYIFDPNLDTEGSARLLVDRARAAGSTPIIFMSYAHESWDQQQREDTIAAFTALGEELDVEVAPLAIAMGHAVDQFGTDDFYFDDRHLTADGHFLSGCIVYATLLDVAPDDIAYDGDTGGLLHHEASLEICQETIRDWSGALPQLDGGAQLDAGSARDAGPIEQRDAGVSATPAGCACRAAHSSSSSAWPVLALALLCWARPAIARRSPRSLTSRASVSSSRSRR